MTGRNYGRRRGPIGLDPDSEPRVYHGGVRRPTALVLVDHPRAVRHFAEAGDQPARAATPPAQKVTIYIGVDPKLTAAEKKQLQAAGEYVKQQLTAVYEGLATVDVQVEDMGKLKGRKGGLDTKLVYGMAQHPPEDFQQVFKDHGEELTADTAYQLGQKGETGGHAAGVAHIGQVVATINVAKLRENEVLLKNRLLHETVHLLGFGHTRPNDLGEPSKDVMKESIGNTEPLLPLPRTAPMILRRRLQQR
jgi:hypothetical protein